MTAIQMKLKKMAAEKMQAEKEALRNNVEALKE